MEYTNGWIKEYADGTRLAGRDEDVASGKVSWTRTPLDNMVAVHLCHGNKVYSLRSPNGKPTKFWQEDDYEAGMNGQTNMVRRKVLMQLPLDLTQYADKLPEHMQMIIEVDLKSGTSREYIRRGII